MTKRLYLNNLKKNCILFCFILIIINATIKRPSKYMLSDYNLLLELLGLKITFQFFFLFVEHQENLFIYQKL